MRFRINSEDGLCIPIDPPRKMVAIIGNTPTKRLAPLESPEWEIWGVNRILNPHYDSVGRFRADRWFEMHPINDQIQTPEDMEWIGKCPFPLYTLLWEKYLPLSLRFPMERVAKGRELFSCTFCYQIALAMDEGFEEIGMFGVDLNLGSSRERTLERMCVLWWLGYAEGKGIRVTVPKASDLLTHPRRYGYDYYGEVEWCKAYLEPVAIEMSPWKEQAEEPKVIAQVNLWRPNG